MLPLSTMLLTAHASRVSPSPASVPARVAALVHNMTLDEKLSMLHGHGLGGSVGQRSYTGVVPATPRLSIPALNMNDGPQGFRASGNAGTSTCWPSGLSVAATWDLNAATAWGTAIGEEFVGKGAK